MKKKLRITDTLDDVFIDGSIESAIAELEDLKETYSNKYDSLSLAVETYQMPYEDWTYAKIVLYGEREETDLELEQRMEKDKKYKERQEELDRKELERLKKLYEKEEK